jgi:membrane-associated protease RseP (regulator of RpoE activity)
MLYFFKGDQTMRATMCVSATLATMLLATGAAVAQQAGGGAAPGRAPPGVQQPALPGGLQPFPGPGGQPFDPQKMQEQMREHMARSFGFKVPAPALKWGGMVLEPAVESLIDQLDLPAGKGMVVASVDDDSAAAKAGLKKNDLLVKVNEQAIPADARELLKALGKSDAALELVIVRKGKEQTLKGVKLPEAAMATRPNGFAPSFPPVLAPPPPPIGIRVQPNPDFPGLFPPPQFIPGQVLPPQGGPGGQAQMQLNINGAKVTLNRDGGKVSADYAKDKIQFSLRGTKEANSAKIEEINVKNGDETKKYTKVEDVPETHRDAVNQVVGMLNAMLNGAGGINRLAPPPPPGLPNAPPGFQPDAAPGKD